MGLYIIFVKCDFFLFKLVFTIFSIYLVQKIIILQYNYLLSSILNTTVTIFHLHPRKSKPYNFLLRNLIVPFLWVDVYHVSIILNFFKSGNISSHMDLKINNVMVDLTIFGIKTTLVWGGVQVKNEKLFFFFAKPLLIFCI